MGRTEKYGGPRRPEGWRAPGPQPFGQRDRPELAVGAGEDLSYLTGDWRIFQLTRGHRWSIDDLLTAYFALETVRGRAPERYLDLGCGIGSVLMMVCWGLPDVRAIGVEAQEQSASLARRSLAWNGADNRCTILSADLRDPTILANQAPFDLITGTPPYFEIGTGIMSERDQRGPCAFETRGGIEEYARAAARMLADDGVFIACVGDRTSSDDRGDEAARAAGLHVSRRHAVIPKVGKHPLFYVYEMTRHAPSSPIRNDFVVRDETGSFTEEMLRARTRMGLPPPP